jgi:hypothetical protein
MNKLEKAYTSLTLGIVSFMVPLWFFIIFHLIWDKGTISGYFIGTLFLYLGMAAVGVAALITGILAVFFGITALLKIKNEPGKYTGKGEAIAGIAISFIGPIALAIRLMYLALNR